jgi:hypothetical protein
VNRDLTPTEGARFLLERERDDGATALYKAAVYTPAQTFEGRATLGEDGSVSLDIAAPADLVETLTMVAKLTARAAAKKREDGMPPWPARVLRWRGPGRGAGIE